MKREKIQVNCSLNPSNFDDLDRSRQLLIEKTLEARASAYAPYSDFSVGCALLLEDGTYIKGSNQENAAYPSGLCAERTALFYAGANYPDQKVVALAVAVPDHVDHLPFPCGSCLQVMAETQHRQGDSYEVYLIQPGTKDVYLAEGANHLIPFAFTETNLDRG
jgi:cytidine deaminase